VTDDGATGAIDPTPRRRPGAIMSIRIIAFVAGLWLASSVAAAPAADTTLDARDVRADFRHLYAELRAAHADLYARRAKPEYDALYARMRRGFARPMTIDEVRRDFQRFVAYGNVAHARIDEADLAWEQYRERGGTAIPLQIRVSNGYVHVLRNLGDDRRIDAGDRLLAIDGRPIARVLDEIAVHLSVDNVYMRDTLMEQRFARLLWRQWGERAAFEVRVRKRDGHEATLRLAANSRGDAEAAMKQRPAFELDWDRREARLLDDGTAYLRPGPFYDNSEGAAHPWDNTAFVAFIDQSFKRFIDAGAGRLLIDLRDNPGGDNSFSDAMLAWFADRPFRFCSDFRIRSSRAAMASNAARLAHSAAGSISHQMDAAYRRHPFGETFSFPLPAAEPRKGQRFGGKVFMLINRHSYSNTANVAALAQDYGFARILGEETADLATTYGAMEQFTLPRSGIVVGFPKAHIVRPNGSLVARGVVPDVAIETPLLQDRSDPVLQAALEIVAR
jgi:hypothetical protein